MHVAVRTSLEESAVSWQVVERLSVYHAAQMYAGGPMAIRTPLGDLMVLFVRAPHLPSSKKFSSDRLVPLRPDTICDSI